MRDALTLFDDDRHRLVLYPAPQPATRTVVCFEAGRDEMDGFVPSHCPAFAERLGIDALIVQTALRDWFLSKGSPALSRALESATAEYTEVTATGFSMGGYGALLYSRAARISRVLLVSPQYSIDPDVAPYDTHRHPKFQRMNFPMPRPEERGNTALRGVLLYDPTIQIDRTHAQRIKAAFPNLRLLALPYGGHPCTGVISDAGKFGRLSTMLVEGRLFLRAIRNTHREARSASPRYALHLARAGLARHPDRAGAELLRLGKTAPTGIRLEAGLALMTHQPELATELLATLMDEVRDAPVSWAHRIQHALAQSSKDIPD